MYINNYYLKLQSTNFLKPGISFAEDVISMEGLFQDDSSTLHLISIIIISAPPQIIRQVGDRQIDRQIRGWGPLA